MPEYKMYTTLLHSLADKMFVVWLSSKLVIVDQIKKSFNNQIFQVDLELFFFCCTVEFYCIISVLGIIVMLKIEAIQMLSRCY